MAAALALAAIVLTLIGVGVHIGMLRPDVEFGPAEDPAAVPGVVTGPAWWGFALLVCYGTGLLLGTAAAGWVWRTPPARTAVGFGITATVVAVLAHATENVLLLTAAGTAEASTPAYSSTAITATAVLKYAALLPAAAVALGGAALLVWRCVVHSPDELTHRAEHVLDVVPPRPVTADDPPAPDPSVPTDSTDPASADAGGGERLIDERRTDDPGTERANRWRNAYVVPDVRPDLVTRRWSRGEDTIGVGLSGGGIRSASVALGALQSLRPELLDARYLVSVSGGGYTAGAFAQALTGAGTPPAVGTVLRNPEAAYGEGTAEFNHVRRHSSYLADTPAELLRALGRLLWGLVCSLTLLFGPAVVGGVAVGWFYAHVPLAPLPGEAPARLLPDAGALVALGAAVLTAAGAGLFARAAPTRRATVRRAARHAAGLAWMIAALVVVLPALIHGAWWVLSRTDRAVDVGGAVGAVLLTYVTALAAMVWRHRVVLGSGLSGVLRGRRARDGLTAALPDGLTQRLLVVVTTALLGALWLVLFGAAALTGGGPTALWTAAVILAVVAVFGGLIDVTSLSLHPFYRERLARAFAVRSVRRHDDGQVVAVPYDPAERTTLSAYGTTAEGVRFPEFVFAAAANVTGDHRTPPGLGAVSYTLSAKWTGGPDVGWVRTDDLERLAPDALRRDLTVQGAVALSGAAFASSMGRAGRWYEALLAVSGARLGAWLPNPAFLSRARDAARGGDWAYPWLPRTRGLTYLVREVFNAHPHHERLVHLSDGAHYDNLGLVELLRRRCTLVYCVDASNDTPPTARTLAQALELAWQELGVRVVLDDPWHADPGSGRLDAPGHPLAARLARTPIITGTVHYPPESGLGDQVTGRLVVARTVLWPDLPYSLQSYAAHHPEFPHDSTGDQWFDHGQFAAYTELGRHLGAEAGRAVRGTDPAPDGRVRDDPEAPDGAPGHGAPAPDPPVV